MIAWRWSEQKEIIIFCAKLVEYDKVHPLKSRWCWINVVENVEEIETSFCEDRLDQGIGYSFVYHNLPQPSMNGSESKKKMFWIFVHQSFHRLIF